MHFKNKPSFIFITGDSVGYRILLSLINNKNIKINGIISSSKRYDKILKEISLLNNIYFTNKKSFKKNEKNIYLLAKKSDYLLSLYSSIIVPKKIILALKKFALNLHPGILPFYPGLNCVSGAIYNDEKFSGISIHKMIDKIDSGDIVFTKKIKILKKETALSLMEKLKILSIKSIEPFLIKSNYLENIKIKKNIIKQKKKFPKFIPENIKINDFNSFDDLNRVFRAGYFGPYVSTWGNLSFQYDSKTYIVRRIIKTKRNTKDIGIKKIGNKKFKLTNNYFSCIVYA